MGGVFRCRRSSKTCYRRLQQQLGHCIYCCFIRKINCIDCKFLQCPNRLHDIREHIVPSKGLYTWNETPRYACNARSITHERSYDTNYLSSIFATYSFMTSPCTIASLGCLASVACPFVLASPSLSLSGMAIHPLIDPSVARMS